MDEGIPLRIGWLEPKVEDKIPGATDFESVCKVIGPVSFFLSCSQAVIPTFALQWKPEREQADPT